MEPWDQAEAIRLAISSAHATLTFCLLVLLALAGWNFKYRTVKLKIPLLLAFLTSKSCQSLICSSWQFYHFRLLYECKWPACIDDWVKKVTSTKSQGLRSVQSIALKWVLWTSVSLDCGRVETGRSPELAGQQSQQLVRAGLSEGHCLRK